MTMPETSDTGAAQHREAVAPASHLLFALAEEIGTDRMTVGAFFDRLDERGLGIVLLVLSLPMCLPNIPGISTLFGFLLLFPSFQMMRGASSVWVPQFLRLRALQGEALSAILKACAGALRRIEGLSRPRLEGLTHGPVMRLVGVQTFVMALVLIIPMWGANLIPGIAVVFTGLAILQRDGIFMLASVPVAMGALAWVYFGARLSIGAMQWLWQWVGGYLSGFM